MEVFKVAKSGTDLKLADYLAKYFAFLNSDFYVFHKQLK